jgi:hypothetical protein
MLAAIKLYNQPLGETDKIDNEMPHWLLPAKLVPRKSFGSQLLPQRMFPRYLLLAQFASALSKPRYF